MDISILCILLSFLLPALSVPILFLSDGRRADIIMLLFLTPAVILYLYPFTLFLLGELPSQHIVLFRSGSIELFGIIIDRISMLIGFVVATAGYLFLLYSIEYLSPRNKEHPVHYGKGRFYAWMMLFIAATMAFIFSSTVIEMLMFFELMSLSCWGVVSFYYTPEARRAALKAFITTHLGALTGLFIATAICLIRVGDLSLYALTKLSSSDKLTVFAGLLIAAITKSAQFPTYSWLPDAMVAPTPASAFLHGAAMIEMGVYLLARGIQFLTQGAPLPVEAFYILLSIVCLTLITTAIMYIAQTDAKRLLAYSTIAESATMYAALVPACLGIERGIYVSMYILALHAYVKGLGFLTTGLFSYYLGKKTIDHVKGLIKASSFTTLCWIVSLLGLAGVPPMPLFFGKLALLLLLGETLKVNTTIALLITVLIIDMISFGVAALRWIHASVLRINSIEKFHVHGVFLASMLILLVFLFIIPYISTFFIPIGW